MTSYETEDRSVTQSQIGSNEIPVSIEWFDDQSIKVVRFHRPERANALDVITVQAISQEINSIPDKTKVVILGSIGTTFSAGVDLSLLEKLATTSSSEFIRQTVYGAFQGLIRSISTCPVPVIAEIQGPALGAAADLVLACDLCVGGEEAWIEETWTVYGLISALGGSFELTNVLGRYRSLEALLTARRLTSVECYQLGIFQSVVPSESLSNSVMELARRIAQLDRSTLEACKSLVRRQSEPELMANLRSARDFQIPLILSEDFRAKFESRSKQKVETSGRLVSSKPIL